MVLVMMVAKVLVMMLAVVLVMTADKCWSHCLPGCL
jgi:hypothetical protein